MKYTHLLATFLCSSLSLTANPHIDRARQSLAQLSIHRTGIPGLFSDDDESMTRTQNAVRFALHQMSVALESGLSLNAVKDIEQLALCYSGITPQRLSRFSQKQAIQEQHRLETLTNLVTTQHHLANSVIVAIRAASTYLRALLTPALYGSGKTRTPDGGGTGVLPAVALGAMGAAGVVGSFVTYKTSHALDTYDAAAAVAERELPSLLQEEDRESVDTDLVPTVVAKETEYFLTTHPLIFDLAQRVVHLQKDEPSNKIAEAVANDDDRCTLALPGEGQDITIERDPERALRADIHLRDLMAGAIKLFAPLIEDRDLLALEPKEWLPLCRAIEGRATLEERHAQVVALYYFLKNIHGRMGCPLPFYNNVMPGSDLYMAAAERELRTRHEKFVQTIEATFAIYRDNVAPELVEIDKYQQRYGYDALHGADKQLLTNARHYHSALESLKSQRKYAHKTLLSDDLATSFYTLQEMQDRANDMDALVKSMAGLVPDAGDAAPEGEY